jgi:alpha-ribazole phosphatase
MLERFAAWQSPGPVVVIAHAGWMLARRWLAEGRHVPVTAAEWLASPKHGELWCIRIGARHRSDAPTQRGSRPAT